MALFTNKQQENMEKDKQNLTKKKSVAIASNFSANKMNTTPEQEAIAEKRKLIASIKKEIQQIKLDEALNKDAEQWKKLSRYRAKFLEEMGRDNDVRHISLTNLHALQPYYTLQNPKKNKGLYKTSDPNAKWVKEYIAKGGTMKELEQKASQTRANTWRRMRSKYKAPGSSSTSTDSSSFSAEGVIKKERGGVGI